MAHVNSEGLDKLILGKSIIFKPDQEGICSPANYTAVNNV